MKLFESVIRCVIVSVLFLVGGCGSQDGKSKKDQILEADGLSKNPAKEGKSAKKKDRSTEKKDPAEVPKNQLPGQDGAKVNQGPVFFASTVKSVFQTMCVNCHADPRQPVEVRAPLSIYSYESMRLLLDKGGAAQDNLLLNTVRNLESHTGGDRCTNGITASPCKEITEWWTLEFAETKGEGTVSLGRIAEVTALGRVYGWAFDPKDTAAFLTVNLYVDGPKGQGTMVGSTIANRPGNDGNAVGDHAFTFDLPEAFRNGKQREIYAYAILGGDEVSITSLPTKYTAYAFSQAGRDFYTANIQGRLNGCAGCHTISYEQQFYSLITPSPIKGGTATNNQLLNKAAQANGVSHGGGQSCGNANSAPCNDFQRWWQIEFGGL